LILEKFATTYTMKFIIILAISQFTALLNAQEKNVSNSLITSEDMDFVELTAKTALKVVLDRSSLPYSIVLDKRDEPQETLGFTLQAGVSYHEVIRQIFLVTSNVNQDHFSWVRVKRGYEVFADDIFISEYKVTDVEAREIGIINEKGILDRALMDVWLEEYENAGYSSKRKTFVLRASISRSEVIESLLKLHRLGYKVPSLSTHLKKVKQK